jgi:hypothetical protein
MNHTPATPRIMSNEMGISENTSVPLPASRRKFCPTIYTIHADGQGDHLTVKAQKISGTEAQKKEGKQNDRNIRDRGRHQD